MSTPKEVIAKEWRNRIVESGELEANQFLAHELNARRHPGVQREALRDSLNAVGWIAPVIVSANSGKVLDGHARVEEALTRNDEQKIPYIKVDVSEEEERLILATYDPISALATYDSEALASLLEGLEMPSGSLESLMSELKERAQALDVKEINPDTAIAHMTLAERFIIPPFSVLDARQGYWQERKRAWIALGIQSELGRGEGVTWGQAPQVTEAGLNYYRNRNNGLLGEAEQARSHYKKAIPGGSLLPAMRLGSDGKTVRGDGAGKPIGNRLTWVAGDRPEEELDETSRKILAAQPQSGTSIFDPVLCELVYRWFSSPNASVLDPFAGGSVRGIVAAQLGRKYTGVDLSARQLEANREQAQEILKSELPTWIEGDSREIATLAPGEYDLVFSCPPYGDLEEYSDDERDLSSMPHAAFLEAYRAIIKASVGMLKDNRFACFVVGDIRDEKGMYRNFVSSTIAAFEDAGARLYNEAILVTSVGSLPLRVCKQFEAGRKLGKTHQNVLVFIKGDAKKATKECGEIDVSGFYEATDN